MDRVISAIMHAHDDWERGASVVNPLESDETERELGCPVSADWPQMQKGPRPVRVRWRTQSATQPKESVRASEEARDPKLGCRQKHSEERLFAWAIALLIPLFAICQALSVPIEEHAHDAAILHVARGVLFSAARADGSLLARWVGTINGGLGGPLFQFYPPLTYLALDWLYMVGLPHPIGWRVVVAGVLVLAATGAFWLGLALSRSAGGGVACAALTVYSYPLLRDLFERGSPQGFAVALWPWALWGVVRVVQEPSGLRLAFAAVAWAAVILTHHVTAVILLPVAGAIAAALCVRYGRRAVLLPVLVLTLGLALSAFFLIPFLAQRDSVHLGNLVFQEWNQPAASPAAWQDLFRPAPAYDLGLSDNANETKLGLFPGLILIAGLVAVPWLWRRDTQRAVLVLGLVLVALATVWLQVGGSDWVWRSLPVLSFLQFRWRLLGAVAVCAGLIAAALIGMLPRASGARLGYAVAGLAMILALPVLYPQLQRQFHDFPDRPTVTDTQTAMLLHGVPSLTADNEFLPRWRTTVLTAEEAERAALTPVVNLPPGGQLMQSQARNGHLTLEMRTPVAWSAAVYQLYFPGWSGYLDGRRIPVRPAQDGSGYLMADVPAGQHTLEFRYEATGAQRFGDLTSVAAAGGLLLAAALWRPRRSQGQEPAVAQLHPCWWVAAALVGLVALKGLWVDPHTTLLRNQSTCEATAGAEVQTDVRFDGHLRLCGYRVSDRSLDPGERLRVTLWWAVDEPVTASANSFVHLLGSTFNPETNNPLWGQDDKEIPANQRVEEWRPGKLYRDVYEFQVPKHTPMGEYQLEIGWWRPADGQRLHPVVAAPVEGLSVSHLDSLLLSGLSVGR